MSKSIVMFMVLGSIVAIVVYFLKALPISEYSNKHKRNLSLWKRLVVGFEYRSQEWKCAPLRRELLKRVHPDTAHRLIASAKLRYPGKPEYWYWEKVIYDLKRGR